MHTVDQLYGEHSFAQFGVASARTVSLQHVMYVPLLRHVQLLHFFRPCVMRVRVGEMCLVPISSLLPLGSSIAIRKAKSSLSALHSLETLQSFILMLSGLFKKWSTILSAILYRSYRGKEAAFLFVR